MSNKYYNNRKLLLNCVWVVTGIVLVVLSFMEKLPSDVWSGMGGGLIGVGLLQIVRNLKYRNNPEYQQKIDIAANDERNRYLRMMAWSWTGYIFVIGSAVVSIILLIAGEKEISQILGLCMCAELMVYCISYLAVGRKYQSATDVDEVSSLVWRQKMRGDVYTGYRVSLSANYPPMAIPLKLDITTGDKITPKEIEYQFKLLLGDRSISVLAYNLETIMAEPVLLSEVA